MRGTGALLATLEHLTSYEKLPPLQAPEGYNLSQVMEPVKAANKASPGEWTPASRSRLRLA